MGLVVMAGISLVSSRTILNTYQLSVEEVRLEMMPIHLLQVDLREVDHAGYRYVIEGDKSASIQYKTLVEHIGKQLDELARIEAQTGSVDHAHSDISLLEVDRAWQQARKRFDDLFLSSPRSVQAAEALKSAHIAIDPVHDVINRYYHLSMQDLQKRLFVAQASGEKTFFAMFASLVIGLCLLIGMGRMVGRSVLQPIAELRVAAAKLREMDFSHKVRLSNTTDELGQLGRALNLASSTLRELYHELELRSSHDGLTGVFNRAAFDERLQMEFTGADRYHRPLSLLMVDIDFFKSVNDTHGHQTGDDVLQAVARLLDDVVREGDVLTRYGGEEFAIILPETDVDSAAALAERLRQAVEDTPMVSGLSGGISLTVSIGCASRSPRTAKPQDLIRAADSALYAAKRSGRNRVVSSESVDSLEPASTQRADAA